MIKLVNDLMGINKLSGFNVPLRSDRAMAIWNLNYMKYIKTIENIIGKEFSSTTSEFFLQ